MIVFFFLENVGQKLCPISFIKRDNYNKKVARGQRMTLPTNTIELLSRHFSKMFCSREDPKLGLVLNLCKNRQGRSVIVVGCLVFIRS